MTTLAGSTSGFNDATGASAQFRSPHGIAIDNAGTLYVADDRNDAIREVTCAGGCATAAANSGSVTTLSGTGTVGYVDGATSSALFSNVHAIFETDSATTHQLYVSDGCVYSTCNRGNDALRTIALIYATATPTPTVTNTATPLATATATTTSGGGSGPSGSPPPSTSFGPPGGIGAGQLKGTGPTTVSGTVIVNQGANVIAGNLGITIPQNFTSPAVNVNVTITTSLPSGVSIAGLAGSVLGSVNGTVFDLLITDAATGQPITTFNAPLTFTVLPNAADLAMAGGNASTLTVIYFIAPNTPGIFNPLGLPINTPVFQPSVIHNPDGTLSWSTQNGAGVVQAVVANPVTYVQTLNASTPELSNFDPSSAQTFGTKPQFSYLQVTEPQIPSVNTLVVLDPDSGNYSYVKATDVAPSGAPPARSSSAVVRGALQGT